MSKPFMFRGKKYRIVEGLLICALEVKIGYRYQLVALVLGYDDAIKLLRGKDRGLDRL